MATHTRSATRTFPTSIELPVSTRGRMIDLLNQQLADTSDLASQLKQAHWNVKGRDFWQLHLLFDKLFECPLEWSDQLAERVTALGGYATGTTRMAAAASRLPEFPVDITEGMDYVRALVERYSSYCASTREAIDISDQAGDQATSDLFIEISRDADKNLYFLESHLQS